MHTQTQSLAPQSVRVKQACTAIFASLLIAISANIEIPLFPVPVTLQSLTVLLIAGLLGSRMGVAAVGCYLLEAALGFPVLAGFTGGLAHLFGPTGGYLFGFLIAAYTVGRIYESSTGTFIRTWLVGALGFTLIMACGFGYLCQFMDINKAISVGILPFLLGEFLKSIFLAAVMSRV